MTSKRKEQFSAVGGGFPFGAGSDGAINSYIPILIRTIGAYIVIARGHGGLVSENAQEKEEKAYREDEGFFIVADEKRQEQKDQANRYESVREPGKWRQDACAGEKDAG